MPYQQAIPKASERIRPHIHCTPILSSSYLNQLTKSKLFFKCENFQKTGAFKIRGAANALLQLSETERKNGVCTHSSGNHAQAVALAASILGTKSYIVIPKNAPQIKRDAVFSYGAEIISCSTLTTDREQKLAEVVNKTGAYFIPPFNHEHVIAGQATVAMEIFEQLKEISLDYLLAPVGGGGLLSGTALSAHFYGKNTRVIGCEPELVNDAFLSLKSGTIQLPTEQDTIADGLRTALGDKTFPIISKYVERIITVSEEMIAHATKLVWERMKIIIEPSAAVPLAVVLTQDKLFEGKNVGLIISGGNVGLKINI